MKTRTIGTVAATIALAVSATLAGTATASAAEPREPAGAAAAVTTTVTKCGYAWNLLEGKRQRCGQVTATLSRIGFYNSWTDSYVWGNWYPRAGNWVVNRVVLGYDGISGKFYGYPQFRRSQDGHIITHGTQLAETGKGTMVLLGYYDHHDKRFNATSIAGRWNPHLYPTEPKPGTDPDPES